MPDADQARPAIVAALLFIVSLVGCQLIGPEDPTSKSSIPGLFDLPTATLSDALHNDSLPDSVNVSAVVVGINVCPENAKCIIADGVGLASNRTDPPSVHIAFENARQFVVNRRYTFSIIRSSRVVRDGVVTYRLHIIGYGGDAR